MLKNTSIAIVAILLIGGAAYMAYRGSIDSYLASNAKTFATTTTSSAPADLGTYQYECDEHVTFEMTPSSDLSAIHVKATGSGSYPPESTLTKDANIANRWEGNGVVFVGNGETVTLGEGDSAIGCSPVADPNNAPFNFGDAQANPDTSSRVSDAVVGKWQSTDDPLSEFIFASDGTIQDLHQGKVDNSGTWKAYTSSAKTGETGVYIAISSSNPDIGPQVFTIARLTSTSLELVPTEDTGAVPSLNLIRVSQ